MHRGKLAVLGALVIAALAAAGLAAAKTTTRGALSARGAAAAAAGDCQLANGIKHVVYFQFDNVHLSRSNPNVPSDLEQMPNLYNFLKNDGTLLNKHYTILISHTAGGILSSLTGLNPDRQGVTVSNSYDYYKPDNTPTFTSAFKYWTAPVSTTDSLPNMVTDGPKNTPAPWVTYTRAGCDVANISVANTVLENNFTTPGGDIYNVYGPGSPESLESSSQRTTDFVGIALHCAKTSSSLCNSSTHAKADPLPDEPGGYNGYQAVFGAKYFDPAINPGGGGCVNDINGNPIQGSSGTGCGFPGFDGMSAANSLGFVAQSLEAGVPITYAYISDVHDNHSGFGAYGPGEASYVNALKDYDTAFGKFFARLAADGINKSNTLFVVTSDENDHYAGEQAQNCDGVTTPCVYNTTPGMATGGKPAHGIFDVTNGGQPVATWNGPATWPPASQNGPLVGEVGYNLKYLLGSTITGTGYDISFDSAPSFYINGQPQAVDSNGNVVLNSTLRAFEQKAANLRAFDPYIDSTQLTPVAKYLVDAPTLKAIHMINSDPRRTMSFTMFSQPDYYFQTFSPCPSPSQGCLNDGFAWIHGDYSNDIGQTWLGIAGPGVKNGGLDNSTWSDHTDIVPTINALTGLTPDYTPDGRAITEAFTPSVAKGANGASFRDLGGMYKQLFAPYGAFNHSLIVASTNGIKSNDTTYLATERSIQSLASQRDALAAKMRDVLNGVTTGHREQLIHDGQSLLDQAAALAGP